MGNPLEPVDFLTAALRASRDAVPDAGFSARVMQRAQTERRRLQWARWLPMAMAFLGVALAFALGGLTGLQFGSQVTGAVSALGTVGLERLPGLSLFAHYGINPWMAMTALGAMLYALVFAGRDPRGAFRF